MNKRAILKSHADALARTRQLAERLLARLEVEFDRSEAQEGGLLAGHGKESCLATLTNLSQLLMKLLPAEQEAQARLCEGRVKRQPPIRWTREEIALLEKFVERRKAALNGADDDSCINSRNENVGGEGG